MKSTNVDILRKTALGAALAVGAAGFTGCVTRVSYEGPSGEVVYADEEPPAPLVEVQGVAPGPDFIWIGGFWGWNGHAYAWNAGHWGHRPYAGAGWVEGRWEHTSHGWHHDSGHWR
jgi:hypothetical protein